MTKQTVLVLDFGGQYKELIARRVRECRVFSQIRPGDITAEEVRKISPIGLIFTGGPNSVYDLSSPKCDPELLGLGIPILGICYGQQLLCHMLGGIVEPGGFKEYGTMTVKVDTDCEALFQGLGVEQKALMSHTDKVTKLPVGFRSVARTDNCENAAIADLERHFYGVQFHPEVVHTKNGKKIFRNFLYNVCGAKGDYTVDDYIRLKTEEIRTQVGDGSVLLGLSGGVDSSVCAALLSLAIPGRLVCIFVDHGLLRKNEGDEVEAAFSDREVTFVRVDARERFLKALAGVSDPEKKRKIIGHEFVAVFNDEAAKFKDIRFLAQGTIYPDIVESGTKNSATIKSHHNVGGLPEDIGFEGLVEPLSGLFKDEVRRVGKKLGLPLSLVERQPFPGPGLGVRIIGEITGEKLDILREADAIFREEVGKLKRRPQQYFAVLTNMRSVGVMGDFRTYDYTLALRAISTSDFMTAEWARLPYATLETASSRIVNEVRGINRVVYDITGKPPATIEWE